MLLVLLVVGSHRSDAGTPLQSIVFWIFGRSKDEAKTR